MIRIGVGGWDFDPWRATFYPPGLPKAKMLDFASRRLTAIEINATYYKLQKPELFARWRDAVPDGFKFAIKGSRYCSNRRLLGEGGEGIQRFCSQGLTELGDKLGPILWQLMATKRFDPDDVRAFLQLLPRSLAGIPLQHAVEPRHESFRDPAFVALCRAAGVAIVFGDGAAYPLVPDISGSIVYARIMRARADLEQGYPPEELDRLAETSKAWEHGESPSGLPYVGEPAPVQPRDVYLFFISAAKERNPAAAMALIDRL
jgi:uncharacterized protein YecE (DUF72 family)